MIIDNQEIIHVGVIMSNLLRWASLSSNLLYRFHTAKKEDLTRDKPKHPINMPEKLSIFFISFFFYIHVNRLFVYM